MSLRSRILTILLSGVASFAAFAQVAPAPSPHDHHRRHFMVLAGESEVFAYHYVYKVPHNYQVILKVRFDEVSRALYLAERAAHPGETFFYYLDKMEIAKVDSAAELVGSLVREDAAGAQTELAAGIRVPRADFDLLFFDEVPVDLK